MAYQLSSTSSVADVITAAINFAVANGWTAGSTWTSGGYSIATVRKGTDAWVVLRYDANTIYANTATSLSGSGLDTAQPGACAASSVVKPITGPHVGTHLFTDGNSVHCVTEVTPSSFSHLSFGYVTKNGTWGGGAYVTSSSIDSVQTVNGLLTNSVQAPFRTFGNVGATAVSPASGAGVGHMRSDAGGAGRVATFGAVSVSGADYLYCSNWAGNLGLQLLQVSPNDANGRAVIAPINILQPSSGVNGPYYQLANVPNAGVLNIQDLDPKSIVNTDWMVFPVGIKGASLPGIIDTSGYGMAYKK